MFGFWAITTVVPTVGDTVECQIIALFETENGLIYPALWN